MVSLNSILCWVAILYSIHEQQAVSVAAAGFAFLLGIGGYYMHIGSKDLRMMMGAINPRKEEGMDFNSYNGPAMPEPKDDH